MRTLMSILVVLMLSAVPRAFATVPPPGLDWLRAYGGTGSDAGQCLLQLADGSIMVAGAFNNGPSIYDAQGYLLKLAANGDTLWTRQYGCYGIDAFDVFNSIAPAENGGFVLAGASLCGGHGNWDGWLVKTDSLGAMKWERYFGTPLNDGFACVQATADGGYVMTGGRWHAEDDPTDLWLVKVDANGLNAREWTYGGPRPDNGDCVKQTPDGGYVVVGFTESATAGGRDVYIVRTDASGYLRWERRYGGTQNDEAHGVVIDDYEDYVVLGTTFSFGPGNGDVWMLEVRKDDGDTTKTCTFGFPGGPEEGISIAKACLPEVAWCGYLICGTTGSGEAGGAGDLDAWLFLADPGGDLVWHKPIGGVWPDRGMCALPARGGGYLMTGQLNVGDPNGYDVMVARLDIDSTWCAVGQSTVNPLTWLEPPTPNPFSESVRISFRLASEGPVHLDVYSTEGRLVAGSLVRAVGPGRFETVWNGRDSQGKALAPGVYFFQLRGERIQAVRRGILIR